MRIHLLDVINGIPYAAKSSISREMASLRWQ